MDAEQMGRTLRQALDLVAELQRLRAENQALRERNEDLEGDLHLARKMAADAHGEWVKALLDGDLKVVERHG